jgi:uncharacterized protein (TIGR02270 family)
MDRPVGALAEGIIWGVVEEHLDELEFGIAQLEAAFEHPLRTLDDIESGAEARLAAHLDGLVIAGPAAVASLAEPILDDAEAAPPARVSAAALSLIATGGFELFATLLAHADRAVRAAAVRAGALAGEGPVDDWLRESLREPNAQQLAGVLELVAARGLEPPPLLGWLQSDDPDVVIAAARAIKRSSPRLHLPIVSYLITHAELEVRNQALIAGLAWGEPRAWQVCEREALNPEQPSALAMTLYALLGAPPQHERLAALLGRRPHHRQALRALGYSGNLNMVPRLLDHLGSGVPDDEAKIAAQAIATITGLDLGDESFTIAEAPPPDTHRLPPAAQDPEARATLPPLAEDDLDADLVPPPEAILPRPDPRSIARWWAQRGSRLDPRRRHLGGRSFSREVLIGLLAVGPAGRRHALGLALGVQTGGRAWIDTRARPAHQRAQLAAVSASGVPFLPDRSAW